MKKRIIGIVLVTLLVGLIGHLAWCLIHHIYGYKPLGSGSVEEIQYSDGTVKTFEEIISENQVLMDENKRLESENADLAGENKKLVEELEELKKQMESETCNGLCKEHCPCTHEDTRIEKSDWCIVKTKEVCRVRTVETICNECEEVINSEEEVDNEHCFNNNGICNDCGFNSNPVVTPQQPSTPPSDGGNTEPTPSVCQHPNTKKEYGEWEIEVVGTAGTCRKATRTVKIVCCDCGEVISTEPDEVVYDHVHNFSGNKCTDCGYTKPSGGNSEPEDPEDPELPDEPGEPEDPELPDLGEGEGEADGEVPPPNNEWEDEDDGELPSPVP